MDSLAGFPSGRPPLPQPHPGTSQRTNQQRDCPWDVAATLVATRPQRERQQLTAQLLDEFYHACSMKLSPAEQAALWEEIRSGRYDESGPCLMAW